MTMPSMELEELAALDAAGALDEHEQRQLRDRLFDASPEERAAIARIYDAAAQVLVEQAAEEPPAGARERLMARVKASKLYSLRADEGAWGPGPVPGTRVKLLSIDPKRDSATILMRVDPGASYPPHHHSGGEDCYVISGEIIVAGQRLHAGDFHRADADSDHGVLASDTGAEVLLVVSASDYR
jgi:anti-sigma factor ChrR (cupin superfamily)